MSASQEISRGTNLEVNTTGSTWVSVGEVKSARGPGYERKEIPLPALMDSVTFKKRGRLNLAPVTLTIGYNKTNYDLLVGYIKADSTKNYRFTMPEGSTEQFSAGLIKLEKNVPDDDGTTFDVSLSISGDSTWTIAP